MASVTAPQLVLEERLLSQPRHRGQRGLMVGTTAAGKALVLQLVPALEEGEELSSRCEQLRRWLVGGVRVLGVWGEGALGPLLRRAYADEQPRSDDEGGGRLQYAFALCTGPSPWTVARFALPLLEESAGVPVALTSAPLLRDCSLIGARLLVRLDVAAGAGGGGAVERAAALLARAIRSQVLVGNVAQRPGLAMAELWTQGDGLVHARHGPQTKAALSATGVISAFAFLHKDCTPEARSALLLDDLCSASVVTRVAAMLDELDALDDELPQARRGKEHALARDGGGAAWQVDPQARWTLPRRVLVAGPNQTVPFCDWQMPWEYDGAATRERFKDMVGLDVELSGIDGSLEQPPPNAQLSLSGLAKAAPQQPTQQQAQPKPHAKQAAASTQQPILLLYVGLIGLLLGLIGWHVFY